jgi:hypothetical protein
MINNRQVFSVAVLTVLFVWLTGCGLGTNGTGPKVGNPNPMPQAGNLSA